MRAVRIGAGAGNVTRRSGATSGDVTSGPVRRAPTSPAPAGRASFWDAGAAWISITATVYGGRSNAMSRA